MTSNVQIAALHLSLNYICNKLFLYYTQPYKHQKTTNLNLNTTKEEGDGNKLPSPSLLEHHHKRKQQCIATPSSSSSFETQRRKR
jgi:hypothetical protein